MPRDVFLTTSARAYQKHVLHGPEIVSIFIANLHAIFNYILRTHHGTLTLFIADVQCGITTVSESGGHVLKFSQTDGIDFV